MAWNEPGGNGKQRDPWGGDQGPPDLDEFWRKLRQKIGGAGGGGGRASDKQINGAVAILVVLVFVALWFYAGIYVIDEKERGVVLRFGRFHEIIDPGLKWNPWLVDSVTIENVTQERQHSSRGQMLTQDENIVELPITVQYNIVDVKAFVLNVRHPEYSLEQATDSALRHVIGSSKLEQVLSEGRGQIGDDVRLKLQSYLDNYSTGIRIVKVTIQAAEPPARVKPAFDDVIKAKEDEERLKNEASAYANGMVPEARGRAQRMLEEAAAYRGKVIAEAQGEAERFEKLLTEYRKSPQVTRERLYLDAVERVLSSSTKVMVDAAGSNNLLYLPLDRMGGDGASSGRSGTVRSETVDPAVTASMERMRRSSGNARQREGR